MDRPELLEMAHRNSAPGMDLGRFAVIFGEWDFYPIYATHHVIGVMMALNNEIHMALDAPYQKRTTNWRDGLEIMVRPLLDQYGCVVTMVQNDDKQSQRFVTRLGFVAHRVGDVVTQYKLTEIKLKNRGLSCQQSQQYS